MGRHAARPRQATRFAAQVQALVDAGDTLGALWKQGLLGGAQPVTLVFLLEERFMKAFIEGLLPRVLPLHLGFVLIPHEGKRDLEVSIPRKLKAWRDPHARFVIVRAQGTLVGRM